jgi:hypothetical protein
MASSTTETKRPRHPKPSKLTVSRSESTANDRDQDAARSSLGSGDLHLRARLARIGATS